MVVVLLFTCVLFPFFILKITCVVLSKGLRNLQLFIHTHTDTSWVTKGYSSWHNNQNKVFHFFFPVSYSLIRQKCKTLNIETLILQDHQDTRPSSFNVLCAWHFSCLSIETVNSKLNKCYINLIG